MIAVGIDQSLTGTGLVVLIKNQVYKSTTIGTKSSDNLIYRVELIRAAINSTLTNISKLNEAKKGVIVGIEGFSFSSRGRSVFDIGYLGWRIKEDLMSMEQIKAIDKWIDIPPTIVKKFCTGKGNAPKELILQQVYKRWNEEFNNNNEADAYVLARIAQSFLDSSIRLTNFQQECIDSVRMVNK